jgi:hypothetical protein
MPRHHPDIQNGDNIQWNILCISSNSHTRHINLGRGRTSFLLYLGSIWFHINQHTSFHYEGNFRGSRRCNLFRVYLYITSIMDYTVNIWVWHYRYRIHCPGISLHINHFDNRNLVSITHKYNYLNKSNN